VQPHLRLLAPAFRRIFPIFLTILAAASPAVVVAQPGIAFGGPIDSMFTYTKQVDEVNMLFTVTDHKGRLVGDLSGEDFRLLDNHTVPEKIRYFQRQSGLPLKVGILIDVSASVTHRLSFEKKGARVFLKKVLRPGIDEGFVVTFDEQPRLLQDFTSDMSSLAELSRRAGARACSMR
jgi:VWFA-related protein